MNLREHIAKETLELLLHDQLPTEKKGALELHLSYCLICREQKDELALQLAAQRMWTTFEQPGILQENHIEEKTFQDFWRGEICDQELIEQLSYHCIACRACRRRRAAVRAEVASEQIKARKSVLTALTLAAVIAARKRHRIIVAVGAVLLLASIASLALLRKGTTAIPPSSNNFPSNETAIVPTPPAQNDNSFQAPSAQKPPLDGTIKTKKPPRRRTLQQYKVLPDLIARAQPIDLAGLPEGDVFRTPDNQTDKTKGYFEIVASPSGSTKLDIILPANSKVGVYYVSVRDAAYLENIPGASAEGKSRDGMSLPVAINIQNLTTGEYVLRITRPDPKTGDDEYIGDYHLLITGRTPAISQAGGETFTSEK